MRGIALFVLLLTFAISTAQADTTTYSPLSWSTLQGKPSKDLVADFGARCNGTTDDTGALNVALAACQAAGSCTLTIPASTCLINSQITFPHDSSTIWKTATIRITGNSGGDVNGSWVATSTTGRPTLDLRYQGATAKLLALGQGNLEIDHITFLDGGTANNTPFLQATNTTVNIHDCTFKGSSTGDTSNDGVIFGGTSETQGNTTAAPFQGYHSQLDHNWFDGIRKVALLQTYANNIWITRNTTSQTCGYSTGGAITVNGLTTAYDYGNVIGENLFEIAGYKYAIDLGPYAQQNSIINNSAYDPSATTTAVVNINDTGVAYNYILSGFHASNLPLTNGANWISQYTTDPFNMGRVVDGGTTIFPNCNANTNGVHYLYRPGTGYYDQEFVCTKNASDAFTWKAVLFSYLGTNTVTNGTFTDGTGWTLGTGDWSVGSNKATHAAGTAGVLVSTVQCFYLYTTVQVTYTVSGRTDGTVQMKGGYKDGVVRSANGTFTETLYIINAGTFGGGGAYISFTPSSAFDGAISAVTAQQLIPYDMN